MNRWPMCHVELPPMVAAPPSQLTPYFVVVVVVAVAVVVIVLHRMGVGVRSLVLPRRKARLLAYLACVAGVGQP